MIDSRICFFLQNDGEDYLKKQQLTELAILRGTYRDSTIDPLTVSTPLYFSSDLSTFVPSYIPIYTTPIETSFIAPTGYLI